MDQLCCCCQGCEHECCCGCLCFVGGLAVIITIAETTGDVQWSNVKQNAAVVGIWLAAIIVLTFFLLWARKKLNRQYVVENYPHMRGMAMPDSNMGEVQVGGPPPAMPVVPGGYVSVLVPAEMAAQGMFITVPEGASRSRPASVSRKSQRRRSLSRENAPAITVSGEDSDVPVEMPGYQR